MRDINEVRATIELIAKHPDCIAWVEFGKGNSCSGPYRLDSEEEIEEEAYALAAVKIVMPYSSELHYNLTKSVPQSIGQQQISYDYLTKLLGRIVSIPESYDQFYDMLMCLIAKKAAIKNEKDEDLEDDDDWFFDEALCNYSDEQIGEIFDGD